MSASTRQARARYRQAQHEGDARQVEILRELEKQYALSSTSLIKIESYRAAERSALTALEASKKGFHAGIRVNLDILNAIQQLHSVQKDLAEASYGYLLARLRLSFHAGAVSINDIMQVSLLMKESDRDPERGADDRG